MRARKKRIEILSKHEVLALIAAAGPGWIGSRDKALLALLWRTGARWSEATALRPLDLDVELRELRVHGKGGQARALGVDEGLMKLLGRWAAVRALRVDDDTAPLFPTESGGRVDGANFLRALRLYARRAGVVRRVHPHALRHTFACELVREGASLLDVQRLLGHRHLSTTQEYLTAIHPGDALRWLQRRELEGA